MAESAREATAPGSWSELFDSAHRVAVTVFAGGIALFATNTYLTAAALPNAVADIGGERLYAWVMTVFLITSVLSSMLVTTALSRFGSRGAYLVAYGTFGVGSLICTLAPTMPILLVGRGIQGLGGGLLTGLAFTVIRVALPARLWVRAVGLTSAMWGVGNLLGPVLGGLFAQFNAWRGAFALLLIVTVVMAILAARALPSGRADDAEHHPIPVLSLILILLATSAVSLASIVDGAGAMITLVVIAAALLPVFVLVDRRRAVGLLPRLTYLRSSPLKWIYLSVVVLAVGSTSEAFIPLFGQQIAGMAPLMAGFLGAALSWGWSVGQLSSTTWAEGPRGSAIVRVAGPAVLATGLAAYGALQLSDHGGLVVTGWFIALFVAGTGIGMAFPHQAGAAMTITPDDAEAARASAGINTVQMVANTFGSALAGLLVAVGATLGSGADDHIASARTLSFGFAAVAALGIFAAIASLRKPAPSAVESVTDATSSEAKEATDV